MRRYLSIDSSKTQQPWNEDTIQTGARNFQSIDKFSALHDFKRYLKKYISSNS